MVATGKGRRNRTTRKELNAEVLVELDALEAALRRMLEAFELRVTGRIAEIRDTIHGAGSAEAEERPLTIQTATAMLAVLRDLELEAERGRARDFSRASRATKLLARLATEG